MGDPRWHSGVRREQRLWSFADCTFDESNWTLTVNGQRVAIESKPLEILRQLLLRPGQVVSKAELLDAIWPDIAVVEASLPTAVHKLRVALSDDQRATPVVETVPRIGYRLSVAAELIKRAPITQAAQDNVSLMPFGRLSERGRLAAAAVIAAFVATAAFGVAGMRSANDRLTGHPSVTQVDLALRRLDINQIDAFIAAGWDVNMPMDADRNTALNRLLDMCEWDPGHDQRRMLLMARTLVDAGTRFADRNRFGDTAYSIAKAPRFCGANHPVTVMLKRMCYNGGGANNLRDRCLASYELKRMAASR